MITVILTGGKSSRMGCDKARLEMNGGVISLVLAKRYSQLGTVAFAVDRPGRFDTGGFVELYDAFPGQGPLNGLYSAFTRFDDDFVFLTATDMPHGDPYLARRLLAEIGEADSCTILRRGGNMEPLFSVYRRTCLPLVKSCLNQGRNALTHILREGNTRFVPEVELRGWDLNKVLMNINTPLEYMQFRSDANKGDN